jgi:hypothetical protein
LHLTALLVVVGCATSPPKPGTVEYSMINGMLTAVEAGALKDVRSATVAAMQELGLRPHERESDAFSAWIVGSITVGSLPQRKDLYVRLSRLTESTTKITLRILFTRDRQKLEIVLEGIRKRLKRE